MVSPSGEVGTIPAGFMCSPKPVWSYDATMKMKTKIALAVLALTAGSSVLAQLSYNEGVVSDYRVRGITQTATQPALQGGVDCAHKNSAYVGAWAANNINWIKEFNGAG